jgi:hypothetical protein
MRSASTSSRTLSNDTAALISARWAAEESLDVSGELSVMLEQEPVGRVGVDLHCGLWDQAR